MKQFSRYSNRAARLSAFFLLNIALLTVCLLSLTGCDEAEPDIFLLKAEKVSDSQILLEWTQKNGALEYKVWRTDNNRASQPAELIATVASPSYMDEDPPLSKSLSYYITTVINGEEKQSNIVQTEGRTYLLIGPTQMELIPGTDLAIIREYNTILLLDYERKLVVKRVEFNGRVGQFDLQSHEGKLEVYIPCSDKNIYIMLAENLTPIETLETDKPVYSVAVTTAGKIICSGSFDTGLLLVYNRSDLNLVTGTPAEMDCALFLQDDNHLIGVSSHISPAKMSYYTLDNDGLFAAQQDDPYEYDYEMDGSRMKVNNKYIVTSTEGFVYNADASLTYITKLVNGGDDQADFEFSEDGNIIYSALTDKKFIMASTITNNTATSTMIPTSGFPWIMARKENAMIVISSPVAFSVFNSTNQVIVEKVTLP